MSVLIEARSNGCTLMSRAASDDPYANAPSGAGARVLIIVAASYSLKYCLVILLFFKRIKDEFSIFSLVMIRFFYILLSLVIAVA